jgi:hypothetical protein
MRKNGFVVMGQASYKKAEVNNVRNRFQVVPHLLRPLG